MEGDAKDYAGKIATTVSGRSCMTWTALHEPYPDDIHESIWESIRDENFPEKDVFEAMNYCRSPNSDARPWCVSQNGDDVEIEYCDVPRCKGNAFRCFSFYLFVYSYQMILYIIYDYCFCFR